MLPPQCRDDDLLWHDSDRDDHDDLTDSGTTSATSGTWRNTAMHHDFYDHDDETRYTCM